MSTSSGTSRIMFSSSFRLDARPYSLCSASLNTKSPNPNSSLIYSDSCSISVLEYFLRKPTPNASAAEDMLSCDDWRSIGIVGLSSLMCRTRSIPASSFSSSASSPLCSAKPTSEITPSRFDLYLEYIAIASSRLVASRILGRERLRNFLC